MCLQCWNKANNKPLKPSKAKIKLISDKHKIELEKYYLLRESLLKEFPKCQVCNNNPSTEIHHAKGRNKFLLKHLISICSECHFRVHNEPIWAKEKGYLLSRLN